MAPPARGQRGKYTHGGSHNCLQPRCASLHSGVLEASLAWDGARVRFVVAVIIVGAVGGIFGNKVHGLFIDGRKCEVRSVKVWACGVDLDRNAKQIRGKERVVAGRRMVVYVMAINVIAGELSEHFYAGTESHPALDRWLALR